MAAVSDADFVAGLGWDAAAAADGGFASANVSAAGMVLYIVRCTPPRTVIIRRLHADLSLVCISLSPTANV